MDAKGGVGAKSSPPGPLALPASAQQTRQAPRQSSEQQGAVESTVVQRLRRELALEKMKSAACQKQLEQASKPSEVSTWAAHVPWVEAIESARGSVWLRVSSSALPGLTGFV